jgi:hypothetical protein
MGLRRNLVLAAFVLAATGGLVQADTITLTNGRVIQADRAWVEGNQVRYERNGGVFGVPRSLVRSLEAQSSHSDSRDPDVLQARDRLAAGDARSAATFARAALARDSRSIPALQTLARALVLLGDPVGAVDALDRALRLDDRDPDSHSLMGDALASGRDPAGAAEAYRRSLALRADPAVKGKLDALVPPPAPGPPPGAQFRLRFDGSVNEPLGTLVLGKLGEVQAEYARRLGFAPDGPLSVILQTDADFEDSPVPGWADGVNDGTIRIPARGVAGLSPRLVSLLRHELAHSFLAYRTRGNCPTWIQEGVAQWLEGRDPGRADAEVAAALRAGSRISLAALEGPFEALGTREATLAYAASLSGIVHLLRLGGEAGLSRLLSTLGDGLPSEEALPSAVGLSYAELQRGWLERLGSAASR